MGNAYRCEYIFDHYQYENRYVRASELADLKDGFWINADYQFTKGSDSVYWIPPNAIRYVQKEKSK